MMADATTDRQTPWRNLRWVFAAIWALFLVYPAISVITSDTTTTIKVIGLILVATFGAVYVLTSVYLIGGRSGTDRRGVAAFAILAVLTVGLVPIIGESAFGTMPFLMVVAAFTFAYGWAVATIAALVVTAVAADAALGWQVDLSLVIVLVAVGFTMLGFRAVSMRETERETAEERRRELDAELAVVAERERVARDVHDILGHSLTVITVKAELAGRLVDLDPDRAKAEMAEVNQLAREALTEVRATVGGLRTPDLPTAVAGARSALDAAGIAAALPNPADVATDHSALFAWVLRETVTNVVRHSDATRCVVELTPTSISVRDNGSGIPPGAFGHGLRGLTERVEAQGATLTIDSTSDGTTVTVVAR